MNYNEFIEFEKELGHPPTEEEVRAYKGIVKPFKNMWFSLEHLEEDMQKCIDCTVQLSTISLN